MLFILFILLCYFLHLPGDAMVDTFRRWTESKMLLAALSAPQPQGFSGVQAGPSSPRTHCRPWHLLQQKTLEWNPFFPTKTRKYVSLPTYRATSAKISFCARMGLQRDVVYLGWPIVPLVYEPKCGERGALRGVSHWVQLFIIAKINFGDLTPNLAFVASMNKISLNFVPDIANKFGFSVIESIFAKRPKLI